MSDGQSMACFSERKGMVTSIHQGIDVAALIRIIRIPLLEWIAVNHIYMLSFLQRELICFDNTDGGF